MEYDNCLRDGTNLGIRVARSKPIESIINNFGKKYDIKQQNINKENNTYKKITKSDIISTEEQIMDISMLSISGNESNMTYRLLESNELSNIEHLEQWVNDMRNRRWSNRLNVCTEMEHLDRRLNDISLDPATGERYLMETMDYRMDLEISKLPLGRNFLQNSNVNCDIRKHIINLLFSASNGLQTDRYTVPMAIACADRYVKAKGKSMSVDNYKVVAFSCWFICCKFDLVYYPSIEDLCEMIQIADPSILINAEVDILKTLGFYVSMPTPIEFLRPLTLLKQRDGVSHNIAKFFLEVCLYTYDLACHPSHIIAAVSYCLSMALSYRMESLDATWSDLMKIFTGIDIEDIRPVIVILVHAVVNTDFTVELSAVAREHKTVIEVLRKRHVDMLQLININ